MTNLICVFRFLDKKRKVMRLWTGTEATYYAVQGRYAISGFCDSVEEAVESIYAFLRQKT